MQNFSHHGAKPSRAGANANPPTTFPTFVDKARLAAARRSTPDSEALASSDDEHEMSKSTNSLTSNPAGPAGLDRRSSWLREVQGSTQQRRSSFKSSTSNNSQPPTPSSDLAAWPSNPLGRVVSAGPVTGAWTHLGNNGTIWGAETRRDSLPGPPNLPFSTGLSSTNMIKPAAPATIDSIDASFPFSIPLHPTPKTYRSQSYSVGQDEAKALANMANTTNNQNQNASGSRHLQNLQSSLAHRPSRPSGLRDAEAPNNMAALREETDDDNNSDSGVALGAGVDLGMHHTFDNHKNYTYRQATHDNTSPRDRINGTAYSSNARTFVATQDQASGFTSFSDQPYFDQGTDNTLGGNLTRRFTDLTTHSPGDGSRRSQWSTTLGFGDLEPHLESRRHSMAELPTRRNSLESATADHSAAFSPSLGDGTGADQGRVNGIEDPQESVMMPQQNHRLIAHNSNFANLYFNGVGPAIRSRLESSPTTQLPQQTLQGYRQGPPQGIFARPGKDTALYLVCFKCGRADVFYVAEGTGLEVKEGDMVIVEADRGYDLGTVLSARVSWSKARELKDKSADEHYRWLMMFSRHNHTPGSGNANNPSGMMAASGQERSPQNTSIGPSGLGTGMFDAAEGSDLKPRMIKRLAQPHEVATLRDKEGNEAKAKRICQQKANELRFGMEILDAEFQMDWKKLSFYYYATGYVNFNPLVQELFKIYKTRIWMSAVNPDSMIAPAGPPRGVGPGAVEGRDSPMNPRSASFRQGNNPSTSGQDYDPTGAIPPYQNPTTRSFQEYAAATTQPGPNGYNSQPDNYLGFAQPQPQYQYPVPSPQASFPYASAPTNNNSGYNQTRQSFNGTGRNNTSAYSQGQYLSAQQQYSGAISGSNSLANSRPQSSAAYGQPGHGYAGNDSFQQAYPSPIGGPPGGGVSQLRQGGHNNSDNNYGQVLPNDLYSRFATMSFGQHQVPQ